MMRKIKTKKIKEKKKKRKLYIVSDKDMLCDAYYFLCHYQTQTVANIHEEINIITHDTQYVFQRHITHF